MGGNRINMPGSSTVFASTTAPTWEPRAYLAVKPRIDERRVLVRSCDEHDELEFPTWHNACRWLRRLGFRNLVITHESQGLF